MASGVAGSRSSEAVTRHHRIQTLSSILPVLASFSGKDGPGALSSGGPRNSQLGGSGCFCLQQNPRQGFVWARAPCPPLSCCLWWRNEVLLLASLGGHVITPRLAAALETQTTKYMTLRKSQQAGFLKQNKQGFVTKRRGNCLGRRRSPGPDSAVDTMTSLRAARLLSGPHMPTGVSSISHAWEAPPHMLSQEHSRHRTLCSVGYTRRHSRPRNLGLLSPAIHVGGLTSLGRSVWSPL